MYQEVLNNIVDFFLAVSTNAVESLINIIFLLIAIFVFGFNFWKKSKNEGYSTIKLFDLMNLALISGLVGTYLLQRIYYFVFINYFPLNRESFLLFPVYEIFMLITVFVTYYFCKRNKWSIWKIGDLAAISLAITQFLLAISLVIQTTITNFRTTRVDENLTLNIENLINIEYIVIAVSFGLIYFLLSQLSNKRFFSSSSNYFFRKRNFALSTSGYLFATYIFFVSAVMMIFLAYTSNRVAWSWWFQLIFYGLLLIFAISIFIYKFNKQSTSFDTI